MITRADPHSRYTEKQRLTVRGARATDEARSVCVDRHQRASDVPLFAAMG